MSELQGKVALVTGATRGIGYAIADTLARDGATVVLTGRSAQETGDALAAKIAEAHGGTAVYRQCDVSDFSAVDQMVKAVIKELGGIDILVNNAGITRDKVLLAMSEQDWDQVLDTNLKSMFNTIHACYRNFMKKKAGKIINISSVSGLMGNSAQANYTAAKGGVIALTKTVARELASRGINCNAIAPGTIETEMTAKMDQGALDALLKTVPMGRMGKPEDIAECVAFLASDRAKYITGEVIRVDGGIGM
ncbi:MAG: 3-oxoacyl-[acyl-carrier-protein] reductase [Oscillospiraceae bacterium]|nr:3-oxoacyl-[acyl-carrier-protein] reductase [Oscillospiraceae bacterium]